MMKRKMLNILGNILLVVCIVYLFKNIYKQDINWIDYFTNSKIVITCIVSIIILIVSIYVNAHIYGAILKKISKKFIANIELRDVYITSNIGKYLPGNVMHFVGRNMLGIKYNIEQKKIVITTIIELLLIVVASLLYILLFGREYIYTVTIFVQTQYKNLLGSILILVFIAFMCMIWIITRYKKVIFEYVKKIDFKFIIKTLVKEVIIFGISALTYLFVIVSVLNDRIYYDQLMIILVVYIISWLVGFILPGAPGGMGVREAILTLLLKNIISQDIILVSVVIHRCLTIIADFMAFLLVKSEYKMRR